LSSPSYSSQGAGLVLFPSLVRRIVAYWQQCSPDHNHRHTTRDSATSATLPRTNCALREGVNTWPKAGVRAVLGVIAEFMMDSCRLEMRMEG